MTNNLPPMEFTLHSSQQTLHPSNKLPDTPTSTQQALVTLPPGKLLEQNILGHRRRQVAHKQVGRGGVAILKGPRGGGVPGAGVELALLAQAGPLLPLLLLPEVVGWWGGGVVRWGEVVWGEVVCILGGVQWSAGEVCHDNRVM